MKEIYIKIDISTRTGITRKANNSEDKWDRDDTYDDHEIHGYKIVTKKNDYWDFIVDNIPKHGYLNLVYVLYDTGDSFHRAENQICFIGLYEHIEDAAAVKLAIKENMKNSNDNNKFNPIDVKLPKNGVIENIGVSDWKGYFERFKDVVIDNIQENKKI